MVKLKHFVLFLVVLTKSLCINAQRVIDGDTFYYGSLKIRLANIDAPELSQFGGKESKEQLIKLLKNKTLKYKILKFDRYNRAICNVYVNNKDISLEMVVTGYAFVYRRYCSSQIFFRAEEKAKNRKLGIWKYKIINPETFRKSLHN